MKDLLIFALCLVMYEVYPQSRDTTISVYSLDYIAADSFYLVKIDTIYYPWSIRPIVVYKGELFKDTFALNETIREKEQQLHLLQLQMRSLQAKIAEADYYTRRVACLRDSVIFQLSCSSGQRTVRPPSEQEVKRYEEFEPQPQPQRSKYRQKMRRRKM